MKIIDLTPEYEKLYFCCLEDWSDEIKEAGNHKECWYRKVKDQGLRVKLALEDDHVVGMIQYVPINLSFAAGNDLYFILCIWVHGHKQGVGDNRGRGIGKALLNAAEEDARDLGAKGTAAWGIILPVFMRASWWRKHGYEVTDRDGMMRLLWKPFTEDAREPSFIRQKKELQLKPGRVNVSLFLNGWCPAQNIVYERTKRAMAGMENCIELNEYITSDRSLFEEWGVSDAVFIDKRKIRNGPPSPYKKIRKIIEKKVGKIKA